MKLIKKQFEICIRGIIISGDRILVCRAKNEGYYFFPGGHLEFGEKAEDALRREINEEIGLIPKNIKFIGISENYYKEDKKEHHEINIVFSSKLFSRNVKSKEKHIDFEWLNFKNFKKSVILPKTLQKSIVKWTKDGKVFRASE